MRRAWSQSNDIIETFLSSSGPSASPSSPARHTCSKTQEKETSEEVLVCISDRMSRWTGRDNALYVLEPRPYKYHLKTTLTPLHHNMHTLPPASVAHTRFDLPSCCVFVFELLDENIFLLGSRYHLANAITANTEKQSDFYFSSHLWEFKQKHQHVTFRLPTSGTTCN